MRPAIDRIGVPQSNELCQSNTGAFRMLLLKAPADLFSSLRIFLTSTLAATLVEMISLPPSSPQLVG